MHAQTRVHHPYAEAHESNITQSHVDKHIFIYNATEGPYR